MRGLPYGTVRADRPMRLVACDHRNDGVGPIDSAGRRPLRHTRFERRGDAPRGIHRKGVRDFIKR